MSRFWIDFGILDWEILELSSGMPSKKFQNFPIKNSKIIYFLGSSTETEVFVSTGFSCTCREALFSSSISCIHTA